MQESADLQAFIWGKGWAEIETQLALIARGKYPPGLDTVGTTSDAQRSERQVANARTGQDIICELLSDKCVGHLAKGGEKRLR